MDVSPEVMAVAAAVGGALLKAATTDAWEGFKKKFARILGRANEQEVKRHTDRLDRDRSRLLETEESQRQIAESRLKDRWVDEVSDVYEQHPGQNMIDDLKELADEFNAEPEQTKTTQQVIVNNTAHDHSNAIGAGIGDVHVNLPTSGK